MRPLAGASHFFCHDTKEAKDLGPNQPTRAFVVTDDNRQNIIFDQFCFKIGQRRPRSARQCFAA
jgi:hypothetical protein